MKSKIIAIVVVIISISCYSGKFNKNESEWSQQRNELKNEPKYVLSGKRDFKTLVKTVLDSGYMRKMRYKYNEILRTVPGVKGYIYTELTIIQDGSVLETRITKSTMGQPVLESYIKEYSTSWQFGNFNEQDTTKVIFPFVFSQ